MNEQYSFPAKLKNLSFALMAIGVLAIITGFAVFHDHPERVWANLLISSTFFLGLSIGAGFFLAAHYVAYGGWQVVLRRVPEAITRLTPIFGLILLAVIIIGGPHIYEYRNATIVANDTIIQGKMSYLNLTFMVIRFIFFVGTLAFLGYRMRTASVLEDNAPMGDLTYYKKNLTYGSIYIVVFAVYILISAWDWLMSIDVHWFSTMDGWYVFGSFWVAAAAAITLVVIYLKSQGYLQVVNANHIHNLGLIMFAFSIFWTYLVFDQYMLQWYANIPEETKYYQFRLEHYRWLFYAIFLINFLFPFLVLMKRDSKRKNQVMVIAASAILIGHFIDYFLMIFPGVVKANWNFGLLELLTPCFFIGLYIFVTMTGLTKASLVPKNDPLLKESLNHHI
jgi:hypothetical protein